MNQVRLLLILPLAELDSISDELLLRFFVVWHDGAGFREVLQDGLELDRLLAIDALLDVLYKRLGNLHLGQFEDLRLGHHHLIHRVLDVLHLLSGRDGDVLNHDL